MEEPAIDKNTEVHKIFAAIIDPKEKYGLIYMDQTGSFPHISSTGYKHIVVLYDYNSNIIIAEPLK